MSEQEKTLHTPEKASGAEGSAPEARASGQSKEYSSESHRHHHRGSYRRYHGDKKKARRRKILFYSLVSVSALAAICCLVGLLLKEPVDRKLRPDYSQAQLSAMNISGEALLSAETEWGYVQYSPEVTVDLSDKTVSLYFLNPADSNQELLLQLCLDDEPIYQTSRLRPGDSVEQVELLYRLERQLSEGGYDGKFVLICYDEETGDQNREDTEIPLVLSVTE